MNLKTRLKSVSFWTTLAGAILMILRAFGIEMGGTEIETAISSIASVLVFSGILIGDKKTTSTSAESTSQDGVVDEAAKEETTDETPNEECEIKSDCADQIEQKMLDTETEQEKI